MCEYCGDNIIETCGTGTVTSPLFNLRPAFVDNSAASVHLATVAGPDECNERFNSPETEQHKMERVEEAGGIGAWVVYVKAFDIDDYQVNGVPYCPMCGRLL